MRLWGLMGPVGQIFLSINLVNELACGYLGEIPRKFKKCVIWIHFPILELCRADLRQTREPQSGARTADRKSGGLRYPRRRIAALPPAVRKGSALPRAGTRPAPTSNAFPYQRVAQTPLLRLRLVPGPTADPKGGVPSYPLRFRSSLVTCHYCPVIEFELGCNAF